MKNLILLISMSFIFSGSFAQKKELKDPIYDENSKKLQSNETKNFDVKIDEFTNAKVVSQVQSLLLFQKGYSVLFCDLKKINDQIRCDFVFSNDSYSILCVNDESNLMLKLTNGEIIKLGHIGKVECGKTITLYTVLSPENLNTLTDSQVEKIRCYTTEGYLDFELFELIPKNYLNKKLFGNYIGENPRLIFNVLIKEIQGL